MTGSNFEGIQMSSKVRNPKFGNNLVKNALNKKKTVTEPVTDDKKKNFASIFRCKNTALVAKRKINVEFDNLIGEENSSNPALYAGGIWKTSLANRQAVGTVGTSLTSPADSLDMCAVGMIQTSSTDRPDLCAVEMSQTSSADNPALCAVGMSLTSSRDSQVLSEGVSRASSTDSPALWTVGISNTTNADSQAPNAMGKSQASSSDSPALCTGGIPKLECEDIIGKKKSGDIPKDNPKDYHEVAAWTPIRVRKVKLGVEKTWTFHPKV